MTRWTAEEKDILINNYNKLEREDILKLLPDRNCGAISKMAQVMGIAKRCENPNIKLSNYKVPNEYVYHKEYCEIVVKNRKTKEEFLVKISNEDIGLVKRYKWFIKRDTGKIYIRAAYRPERYKSVEVMLHRLILNNPTSGVVDHINGDTLDNRRENLRHTTFKINSRNRVKCNSNTGIIGVHKIKIKSGNGHLERYRGVVQSDGIKVFHKTYKNINVAELEVGYARRYVFREDGDDISDIPNWIIRKIELAKVKNKKYVCKKTKFRNEILQRDNYTCKGCNKYFEDNTYDLHIHHIIPLDIYSDGEYEHNNCISLCKDCHQSIKGRELYARNIFDLILEKEKLKVVIYNEKYLDYNHDKIKEIK